ncbi:disulfide bond formation protein DsbA [Billgrantia endophytica]|uniref:Disulfide bond formation protein DsbA n=2 Tax=Billgrantia endophytica TaxID=2033802 RepID=A0A2N7U4C5_9GAMM|nr:disulfide bond formation protein DsbA [Halomonas endophytica]
MAVTMVLAMFMLLAWTGTMLNSGARPASEVENDHSPRPPWRYGNAEARFTVIAYADLECPHCQTYTPMLMGWIDQHPGVDLQWHHLPLAMHEPAATQHARLAECVGETEGHAGFWRAVVWLYRHTRGDGQGLPSGVEYPGMDDALRACLDSSRPDAIIHTQRDAAQRDGITATPTLRLVDQQTDHTLTLLGPVEGDALLSALDLLTDPPQDDTASTPEMPADTIGDMPRQP